MKFGVYLSLIFQTIFLNVCLAQKLGFNELTIGIDSRSSSFYQWSDYSNKILEENAKSAKYIGVSARFATSFLAACYANKFTKWRIADILIGEVGMGVSQSEFNPVKSGFFPTYDFTIGFGGIYRINSKQDIGLNFGMLRFARSLQSKNFSGSNVYLKYRYRKIFFDIGLETWNEFFLSWIYIFNSKPDPIQFAAALKYAFNDQQLMGIRVENNSLYDQKPHYTEFGKEQYWNLRLFYGIYF